MLDRNEYDFKIECALRDMARMLEALMSLGSDTIPSPVMSLIRKNIEDATNLRELAMRPKLLEELPVGHVLVNAGEAFARLDDLLILGPDGTHLEIPLKTPTV